MPHHNRSACSRIRLSILPLCGVLAGLLANPLHAAPGAEDVLSKRRQSISQLNETQRQELVRKYDAYRNLSEGDRNQLKKLHQDIEANRELKDVMTQYCEWLKNLDVAQREMLRQAKTPEQKRDLVVRFRSEQLNQKSEMFRDEMPPPDRRLLAPLTGEDLKKVMASLEEDLVTKEIITKERQEELAKLPGTQRYKMLMNAIGDYRSNKGGTPRRFSLPDPVLTTIAEAIPNPELKRKIHSMIGNSEHASFGQAPIFMILRSSALTEAYREFHAQDADTLKESIFQTFKPEMQSRFSQLPLYRQDLVLMDLHANELRRAFATAGDIPMGPPGGDRGQFGRPNGKPGDRPRDGGQRPEFKQPRNPDDYFGGQQDGRRPPRERDPK